MNIITISNFSNTPYIYIYMCERERERDHIINFMNKFFSYFLFYFVFKN